MRAIEIRFCALIQMPKIEPRVPQPSAAPRRAIDSQKPISGSTIEIDAVTPLGFAAQPEMASRRPPNGHGSVVISGELALSAAARQARRQNGEMLSRAGALFGGTRQVLIACDRPSSLRAWASGAPGPVQAGTKVIRASLVPAGCCGCDESVQV